MVKPPIQFLGNFHFDNVASLNEHLMVKDVTSSVNFSNTSKFTYLNCRAYQIGNLVNVIFTAKAKVNLSANFSETIFTVDDAIKPRAVDVWCAYSALAQNVNNGNISTSNAYVASYNSTFYGRSSGAFTAEATGIVGSIWWEI